MHRGAGAVSQGRLRAVGGAGRPPALTSEVVRTSGVGPPLGTAGNGEEDGVCGVRVVSVDRGGQRLSSRHSTGEAATQHRRRRRTIVV